MIYATDKYNNVLNNIKNENIKKSNKYYKNIIDCRKFKYYRTTNSFNDERLQTLLELSNEYQKINDVQDMCLTNSFLFKQILDELDYKDFELKCGMWIMRMDCKEFIISHVVLYNEKTDTLFDPSWWASRNLDPRGYGGDGGYFTFEIEKVINEAFNKNKIDSIERAIANFNQLDECTAMTVEEVDYSNSRYYYTVLKYLKNNTDYKFLNNIDYYDFDSDDDSDSE